MVSVLHFKNKFISNKVKRFHSTKIYLFFFLVYSTISNKIRELQTKTIIVLNSAGHRFVLTQKRTSEKKKKNKILNDISRSKKRERERQKRSQFFTMKIPKIFEILREQEKKMLENLVVSIPNRLLLFHSTM